MTISKSVIGFNLINVTFLLSPDQLYFLTTLLSVYTVVSVLLPNLNASESIVLIPLPILKVVKLLQSINVLHPMLFTESGMLISWSD